MSIYRRFVTKDKIFAPIRSSAEVVGDNIVSMFVGGRSRKKTSIVEFNISDKKEKGRIDIHHPNTGGGFYRVVPFNYLRYNE